ncbi:hypothetical protein [Cucumibacter marinus]|uniref:hypothetical protein n=1 Tax=Cucumibacter marinus TaxID=1121252 RepID=UPI000490020A|nr:hypothetical protein [Cucumibacter marinus]
MANTHTPSTAPSDDTIDAWKEFIGQWKWDRSVTLAFNQPGDGQSTGHYSDNEISRQKRELRKWDARMNRRIFGREWANLHHRRLFYVYTLEKASTNPHWHGLIRFYQAEGDELERQARLFDTLANTNWQTLVPSGNVDVRPIINQEDAIGYLAKSLGVKLNFENYILPDAFVRG